MAKAKQARSPKDNPRCLISRHFRIAERYHAPNTRVFGSVARGEATENSDIDFLIAVLNESLPTSS